MPVAQGPTGVSNLKLGTVQAIRAYIGTSLVWQSGATQTWTRSPATVTVSGTSGTWVRTNNLTWTGTTVTITVTGISGTWGVNQVWTRTTATITVAGSSGTWARAQVWTGSTATVTTSGTSGTWATTNNLTWTRTVATVTVTGTSGVWGANQVWTRSAATVTTTGVSSTWGPWLLFTRTIGTVAAVGTSGTWSKVQVWVGSTATIAVTGVSSTNWGPWKAFVRSTGTVTVSGTSGTWARAQVWTRSTGTVTVTGAANTWGVDQVIVGSPATVSVLGRSDYWSRPWARSTGTISVNGISGTWSRQPSPPSSLNATTASSTSIALTWTAPADAGITDYIVQYRIKPGPAVYSDDFVSTANPLAAPWTRRNGTNSMQSTGGQAVPVSNGIDSTYTYADMASPDHWVEADVRCDDGFAGVQARIKLPFRNEAVDAVINPGHEFALNKHVDGAETTLDNAGGATAGVVWKLRAECLGNNLKMFANGTLVNEATSSAINDGLGVGIGSYRQGGTLTIDNFKAGLMVGPWVTFTDTVSATTGATVTGLASNTEYDFQVATVTSVQGAYSAPVSGTTSATALTWSRSTGTVTVSGTSGSWGVPPGAPTGLDATAGDTTVSLVWTAPAGTITDYVVQYRPVGGRSVLASDAFTGTDGAGLASPWATRPVASGAFQISGNKAVPAASSTDTLYRHSTQTALKGFVQADIRDDDGYGALHALIGSEPPRTETELVILPDNWIKLNSAGAGEVDAVNGQYSDGATINLRLEWEITPGVSTALRGYVNNSLQLEGTISATPSSYGVGMGAYRLSGTTTFEDWQFGSLESVFTTFDEGVSTATSATVTGLTNGTAYEFQVAAKNGSLVGAYSSVDSATPSVGAGLTWTRSTATVTTTGTSGTWSRPAAPQTWTGSTATVTASGISGAWSAPAFPVLATFGTADLGTSMGAQAINAAASIAAGDLLIGVASLDNSGTALTASTGWTTVRETANGAVVRLGVFARIADGGANDALTITGAAQDYCAVMLRITTHGVVDIAADIKSAIANAASGNANPPSLDASSSKQWMWLALAAVDLTTGESITVAPTNYTSPYTLSALKSANSTSSCALGVATRNLATQTEDPGTFTNNTQEWAAATVAIPPLAAGSSAPGAPTSLSGTAASGAVSLTWTAPSANGAYIYDYVVQWATAAAPTSWTTFSEAVSSTTGATVTGLTNGTAYIFRVAAKNSLGQGSYSSNSSEYTPTAGGGATAFVQANTGYNDGPVTLTGVTAGNCLVASMSGNSTYASTTMPAGWVKQTPAFNSGVGVAVWVYPNHPGGSVSAAITGPGGDNAWSIHEYSGVHATNPVENYATLFGNTLTFASTAVSVSTGGAVFVHAGQEVNAYNAFFTAPFTQRTLQNNHTHETGDRVNLASGSYSATGQVDSNATAHYTAAVALRPA